MWLVAVEFCGLCVGGSGAICTKPCEQLVFSHSKAASGGDFGVGADYVGVFSGRSEPDHERGAIQARI